MKFKLFAILLITLVVVLHIEAYSRNFLKIENCTSSGKSSVIEECSIINNRLNIVIRIFGGSNNAYFQFNLYKIEGKNAKRIFKMPKINACDYAAQKSRINPMLKVIINIMQSFYGVVKKCPFTGVLTLSNLSLSDKNIFILPTGVTRLTSHVSTDNDDILHWFSLLFEVEN
ncbi:hypothetical protein ACKWTF_015239 [Chironomus riparius]